MQLMTDLSRFHSAQRDSWPTALAELLAGAKQSHWMWYVFPQLRVLGRSPTAQLYGIADLAEARAYLADPVLGPRLREAAAAMLLHTDRTAEAILGTVDAMKLRSCATLFEAAAGRGGEQDAVFAAVLDAFYGGVRCDLTLQALGLTT